MDRIDTHHHFSPPAFIEAFGADKLFNGAAGSRIACYEWTPQLSLADMDRGGARTAILSIHTHGPLAGHPDKARIARACNPGVPGCACSTGTTRSRCFRGTRGPRRPCYSTLRTDSP